MFPPWVPKKSIGPSVPLTRDNCGVCGRDATKKPDGVSVVDQRTGDVVLICRDCIENRIESTKKKMSAWIDGRKTS